MGLHLQRARYTSRHGPLLTFWHTFAPNDGWRCDGVLVSQRCHELVDAEVVDTSTVQRDAWRGCTEAVRLEQRTTGLPRHVEQCLCPRGPAHRHVSI